jgi:hypothetical protein
MLIELPPLKLPRGFNSVMQTDKKSSIREPILFGGRLRDFNEQGNSSRFRQTFHKSTSATAIISRRGSNNAIKEVIIRVRSIKFSL